VKKVSKKEIPLVSVCLITYNHVNYISQAIEGVLMQDVDFSWELIIADDCSNDGTRLILEDYQKKFPNKIKLILQKKNVGAAENWLQLVTIPRSKYIVYFEGDDYWISSRKMQAQFNFLEENLEFSVCFTDYSILDDSNQVFSSSNLKEKLKGRTTFGLKDIIKENFIPSPTLMYRKSFNIFPDGFSNLYPGDWPLHILNAQYGKIKFLPIISVVYRKHDLGFTSSSDPIISFKQYLKSFVVIRSWFKDADYSIKMAFFYARIIIYKDIVKHYIKLIIKHGKNNS
jgi:glycosyltransferase involved in cell wall biosynthesis